jgi:hypothetical protein
LSVVKDGKAVSLEADWNRRILSGSAPSVPSRWHTARAVTSLLCLTALPKDLVPKIRGGMPGTDHNGEMFGDYLVEMTTGGQVVSE